MLQLENRVVRLKQTAEALFPHTWEVIREKQLPQELNVARVAVHIPQMHGCPRPADDTHGPCGIA